MIINIFNDKCLDIFKYLSQFNSTILEVASKATYTPDNNYDLKKGEASYWFNPEKIKYTPITPNNPYYPSPTPFQYDKKFCLEMHTANYVSLIAIAVLFADRKDIIVEDLCCGMSQISFYLSKLGFKNFAMFDNFTQMPRLLLDEMVKHIDGKWTINLFTPASTAVNLIQYPIFPKRVAPDGQLYITTIDNPSKDPIWLSPETELCCSNYYPSWLPKEYELLALDNFGMVHVFSRKDKTAEFAEKLKDYQ